MNRTFAFSAALLLAVGIIVTDAAADTLGQIVVPDGNTTSTSVTSDKTCERNEDWTLTEPWGFIGAGGFLMLTNAAGESVSMTLDEGAILVLNPPRVPVCLGTKPTFSGGKLALASEYQDTTVGQFTLLTWTDGSTLELPADSDTIFTNTTSATSYELEVIDATWAGENYKQLRLTLGSYKTAPKKSFSYVAIGDSITEGVSGGYFSSVAPNWRIPLAAKLTAAGYNVTTLGYLTKNPKDSALVNAPLAWRNHAGVSGEKLVWFPSTAGRERGAVRESLEAILDQAGDPDLILLKIGTNDIKHDGLDTATYIASLTNTIWRALAYSPHGKVIVSTLLDQGYDSGNVIATAYNEEIRKFAGTDATYGFPENRVFVADNYNANPRYVDSKYTNCYLKRDNLHPNWQGYDLMSDCWMSAIETALAAGDISSARSVTTTSGAENNVPAEYLAGFTHAATLNLNPNGDGRFYLAKNTAPTYTMTNDGAPTENLAAVGYYLELKRIGSDHRRWVWVDVAAFGDKALATCGFPGNYTKWGEVGKVHVASNDPQIHIVAADDDSCIARLEFTSASYSAAAETDDFYAPADLNSKYDWNDSLGTGKGGSFQIHRILKDGEFFTSPAEVVFAFNNWSNSSASTNQVGIGNFAQHVSSYTIDYTSTSSIPTMNASAYEVISLEIWTKADTSAKAEPETAYLWTGAAYDGLWSNPDNWCDSETGSATLNYPGYDSNGKGVVVSNRADRIVVDADVSIPSFKLPAGTKNVTNELTLAGGNALTFSETAYNFYVGNYRHLTIDGPAVTLGATSGSANFIGVANWENKNGTCAGSLTIKSGTVNARAMYANGGDALIAIDGGTVSIRSEIQVNNGATLAVNGGTVLADNATLRMKNKAGAIQVNDGSLSVSAVALATAGDKLEIKGGSLSAKTFSTVAGTSIVVSEDADITFTSSGEIDEFANAITSTTMNERSIQIGDTEEYATVTDYYKLAPNSSGKLSATIDADNVMDFTTTEANPTPFAVGETTAEFSVANVKRGFWYSVVACDTLDGTFEYGDAEGQTKQATEDDVNLSLSAPKGSGTSRYFKIAVSDVKPQAD